MKFAATFVPILLLSWLAGPVAGAVPRTGKLADQLTAIRGQVISLEQDILKTRATQKQAQVSAKKIKTLIDLQREERALGKKRLSELEKTVAGLEDRKKILLQRIDSQRHGMRRFLLAIDRSEKIDTQAVTAGDWIASEKLEAPRRKVLARLVDHGVKELEALKIDLVDAGSLEARIEEERQHINYLFQDLREQESVLELNRQLQDDLFKSKHEEKLAQLESYRRLKSAEAQVEELIGQFNARLELEKNTEAERVAAKAMNHGVFALLRGKLPYPVTGSKVLSEFGRVYDSKSQLYIFKKGVDLAVTPQVDVRAISAGKIAYSGELPDYGRVAIIDHGDHFYSLCAHLGSLAKGAGDAVVPGDVIGKSDAAGTPVYFEIRARNVAVNPLQWVSN